MTPSNNDVSSTCHAMGEILNRIGDKWSVMIVGTLHDGPVRFNQIKRTIGGISQRMLSRTLGNLERDGLVSRTQYNEIPPRVEYELTTLGKSLLPVINELWNWSQSNYTNITTAQQKFDKAKAE